MTMSMRRSRPCSGFTPCRFLPLDPLLPAHQFGANDQGTAVQRKDTSSKAPATTSSSILSMPGTLRAGTDRDRNSTLGVSQVPAIVELKGTLVQGLDEAQSRRVHATSSFPLAQLHSAVTWTALAPTCEQGPALAYATSHRHLPSARQDGLKLCLTRRNCPTTSSLGISNGQQRELEPHHLRRRGAPA